MKTKLAIASASAIAIALAALMSAADAATLLPDGKQQFFDANGNPLASGSVYFYIPATTTPKTTWQDANGATPNANPVVLDAAGRAVVYGMGSYRQIVKDSSGNTIWDTNTASTEPSRVFSGVTSGGSGNAQTLTFTPPVTSVLAGDQYCWTAGFANSAATVLNVQGTGNKNIFKPGGSGPVALVGGEIVLNNEVCAVFDGTQYQLTNPLLSLANVTTTIAMSGAAINEAAGTIAAAGTTDLSTVGANYVTVTGSSTTINALGTLQAGAERTLKFASNSLTLANSLALTLPVSPGNIVTNIGDIAKVRSEGAGNWTVVSYMQGAGPGTIQGLVKNLRVQATSDTAVTITADNVAVADAGNHVMNVLPVSLTLSTSTNGTNGIDSGSVATNTWYSVWVITNGITPAGLLSTSATAPTLPSGYSWKARVGWVRTDVGGGTTKLIRSIQFGRRAQWVVNGAAPSATLPVLASGVLGSVAVPTWVAVQAQASSATTGLVPSTAGRIFIAVNQTDSSPTTQIVAPNASYGAYNSVTNPPPCTVNANASGAMIQCALALETTNLQIAQSGVDNKVFVLGWEDNQ